VDEPTRPAAKPPASAGAPARAIPGSTDEDPTAAGRRPSRASQDRLVRAPESAPAPAGPSDPAPDEEEAAAESADDAEPAADSQDVQDSPTGDAIDGKEIRVRSGDTLYQLAWRTYGTANYTTLDMLRAANPGIQDVNRIVAGRVLTFPDPGPESRIVGDGSSLAVLAITTPEPRHAEGVQRKLQEQFGEKVEIEPVVLGEGQRLYRVSLRELQGESQARSIAESLGTILDDPDERPGS
jgi:phage tail protein X